jgi:excinuclease ABC subunit C
MSSAPPSASPAFDPAAVIAGLPHLPGVYRMLNAAGEALYVGKARDLRKRVASYFQKAQNLSPRIQLMIAQVAALETTVTRSESEALLLENNLIKALAPRYNILFRDDKSYPYLVVTGHAFPQLRFHRGTLDRQNKAFGPFPNSGAVRESIQLLQRVFRLRTCEDSVFGARSRPCLLHQIQRCSGPCVGLIAAPDYAADVRAAMLFLEGKDDEVVQTLEARMAEAAGKLEYERAAMFRDQIGALRNVRERQFVESERGTDADIVACAEADGVVCVNLAMVRGGRHLGDKNFFPRNAGGADAAAVLEAFVSHHYAEHLVPPLVIVGGEAGGEGLAALLSERATRPVAVLTRPNGERRVWLEMATKNAALGAGQQAAMRTTQEGRVQALAQALGLTEGLERIECFDISHTMGEATVASCVVYERAGMKKSDYRRFNIETAAAGDDYAAMREVLTRRYRRVVDGEAPVPDLVLIDGGKGQLAVAVEVMRDLGLGAVPLVGVAKGEARKPGLEQLFVAGREEALQLPKEHPGLHLIQQIRDEAHRFAIEGHRARRGRTRNQSPLETIEGVGAKRRQSLLMRFGGLKGLASASVDDLARVPGVSRTLAQRIYDALH